MHITGTEYYVLVLCTALLLLSITMLLSMYSGVCIMSIDTPYILYTKYSVVVTME